MKKLIHGIVDFRKNALPEYKETFARLALGQTPDALFIACSDSRVVPNLFASSDPGDLFVVRNVGNLIPPCADNGRAVGDESEAAAIEFALDKLAVTSIVVCGHSECGAMFAAITGREKVLSPNLRSWLRFAEPALARLKAEAQPSPHLAPHNHLSQLNVLAQMESLRTYPIVRARLKAGTLKIFGWWFDIATADVYAYDESRSRFVIIDESEAERMLADGAGE